MQLTKKKSATLDITEGFIPYQVILFALPMMLGNVFQMLYNTVDSIVVGNYVSTQALAAVGSTTMITNMAVFFFNGFSIGATVVIGKAFGAKDMDRLHKSVETTMAATFLLCLLFSVGGFFGVRPMLRFMSTPEDVFADATVYLQIYFAGITGLLIYNVGSAILRAVGDSKTPLYFLMVTSILNIILDLLFVLVLHQGISGVAYATVLSQMLSAVLVLTVLTRTSEIYKMTWHDLRIEMDLLAEIFAIGIPTGIQAIITSFSNVFVQSYINFFGSACMAGWSCYNKLDQFIFLPIQSMSMAAATLVSQNMGAKKLDRADKGAVTVVAMAEAVTLTVAVILILLAAPAVGMFTDDEAVIGFGVAFLRTNTLFLACNCVNHVLAGALRGMGDSKAPMVIMLLNFVAVRQLYLFCVTRFVANTPFFVGFGYPVGWTCCCITEMIYYLMKRKRFLQQGKL